MNELTREAGCSFDEVTSGRESVVPDEVGAKENTSRQDIHAPDNVSAPHIRQRPGDTFDAGLEGHAGHGNDSNEPGRIDQEPGGSVAATGGHGGLADTNGVCREGLPRSGQSDSQGVRSARKRPERLCAVGRMADTERDRHDRAQGDAPEQGGNGSDSGLPVRSSEGLRGAGPHEADRFWGAADWLYCRDGKWRAVESINVEMADGVPDKLGYVRTGENAWSINPLIEKGFSRVGRLKAYGNAVVPPLAAEVIKSFMEIKK